MSQPRRGGSTPFFLIRSSSQQLAERIDGQTRRRSESPGRQVFLNRVLDIRRALFLVSPSDQHPGDRDVDSFLHAVEHDLVALWLTPNFSSINRIKVMMV